MKNCKIISRKDYIGENKYNSIFRIHDKDFKCPLAGISDYVDEICIGDIVGVHLELNEKLDAIFKANSHYDIDINDEYDEKNKYIHREEHFFKITKIKDNNCYEVKQVFLDKDKVIVKSSYEAYTKKIKIQKKLLPKIELCRYDYELKNIDYDFFHSYYQKIGNNTKKSNMPYMDYKSTLFDLESINTIIQLEEFISDANKFSDILKKKFGNDILEKIGTIEKIKEHMENIYQNIFQKYGDYIEVNVNYSFEKPQYLDKPKIIHNINELNYSDIYRIIKDDKIHKMIETKYITQWNGIIIDNEARKYVNTGYYFLYNFI